MAGTSKSNPANARKRVEAESSSSLKRAKDGSAFARCDECNKDVPVVLIDMHNCTLEAKIKMNLEAQVVEKATEVKKTPTEKMKQKSDEPKAKKSKKGKGRDPNAPKRPQTAFFLFMDDFRKIYKEAHPESKGASAVAKEGGEKWKAMTDEEKKPYVDKSAELKLEYEKAMESYKANNADEEGVPSDKEVQEVQEVSDNE